MSWIRGAWRRIRSVGERAAIERGMDEELQFHVDRQIDKNVRAGMNADEARRQALLAFGGVQATKERARDEFRPAVIEDTIRDLRYSLRALRRAPGFTLIASLTLALGIGATTAVFSVVNGVLLKPLPYPDPDALVGVWHIAPGVNIGGDVNLSDGQFVTYREENRTFQEIGLWTQGTVAVTALAEPERIPSLRVSFSTLAVLGVGPAMGRGFSESDDRAGAPGTVILTHHYWQRRFGGDVSVIGRNLIVDAEPREVIGIMPPGFEFLSVEHDLLLPFRLDRGAIRLGRFNNKGIARLRPGVTVAQANADVARMIPIWLKAWPEPAPGFAKILENTRLTPALRPLKQDVVGDIGNVLWVLMGTIGIVLLIACANVANLLLVRVEGRQQELAVRAALGAGWARIARELLLESLVLGLIGGAIGLGLAFGALRLLVAIGPSTLPRLNAIAIDPLVLAFAIAVSLFSGLLFAIIPIVRHAGPHIALALRGGGRTASQSRERHRARNTLVVAQIALSLVLLVGSGLMIRTFLALRAVDPGFTHPEHIQLMRISIPSGEVADPHRALGTLNLIRDRIAALPGVSAVSFASSAPMEHEFDSQDAVTTEGRTYAEGELPPVRRFEFVSPGVFETLGTRFVAGRDIAWADIHGNRPVVIISENAAREMWREPSAALGKRIRGIDGPWREIIGVVSDVHDDGVHEKPPATMYWPILMKDFWRQPVLIQRSVTFVIRTSRAGTESFMKEIREGVWAVNGNLPLAHVRTLKDVYDRSLARTSFTLVMLAIAAAMALALGIVGIYGVIAYAIAQRTREIGIRMALGAQHAGLKRLFVREGLVLATTGIAIGLGAAVALTRFMTSFLFGVSALDVTTYAAVSCVLLAVAMLASYLPAERATAVDPVVALRAE
jgi:predicted permease